MNDLHQTFTSVQFPLFFVAANCPINSYHFHSKVCSLPSKTPLHCHLCPDASPEPVDDRLHGFAHQWHGDSHAARCTGWGPQAPWQDETKGSERKFQESSHKRNDEKLNLFSTLHYPFQQLMALMPGFFHPFGGWRCLASRLKPPGHYVQPAQHQPRQDLRYLSLLSAGDLQTSHPNSQF